MITFAVLILCGKTPLWKDWFTIKKIIWENKWILDLSIKIGILFGPNDFLVSSEDISFAIAAGVACARNIKFVICFLNKEMKWFLEGCIFWATLVPIPVKNLLNAVVTCTGSDIDLFPIDSYELFNTFPCIGNMIFI